MGNVLWIVLWLALALAGIYAMQWGSNRMCGLVGTVRSRFGLPATAGGAFIGAATALPEISVNLASVSFGWPDLGLGAALGSNVPALPLIVLLSYLATRHALTGEPGPSPHAPRVQPDAVPVQVAPYILVILLLAAITLPPWWSGLQWYDAVILAGAYGLYILHVLRRKGEGDGRSFSPQTLKRALVGVPAIAGGALAAVIAARRLTDLFGLSDLVGGLFIIGLLCALPESFAAWKLTREGKTTTAVSGAVADGIVSLTLALIPAAIVGSDVGDRAVYSIALAYLVAALLLYVLLNRRRSGQSLGPGLVALYVGGYGVYLVATVAALMR